MVAAQLLCTESPVYLSSKITRNMFYSSFLLVSLRLAGLSFFIIPVRHGIQGLLNVGVEILGEILVSDL